MNRTYVGDVSCVMVTQASRLAMAHRAVRAFQRQVWAQKELIIVTYEGQVGWEYAPDPRIKHIILPQRFTLGDMRNFGVAASSGDMIAPWDDDDISHPDRLAAQVCALQPHVELDGVCLESLYNAWPAENRYWVNKPRKWEGTALIRRYRLPAYAALDRGEDSRVLKYLKLGVVHTKLYIRTVHGANTWNRGHFQHQWENRLRDCDEHEIAHIQKELAS